MKKAIFLLTAFAVFFSITAVLQADEADEEIKRFDKRMENLKTGKAITPDQLQEKIDKIVEMNKKATQDVQQARSGNPIPTILGQTYQADYGEGETENKAEDLHSGSPILMSKEASALFARNVKFVMLYGWLVGSNPDTDNFSMAVYGEFSYFLDDLIIALEERGYKTFLSPFPLYQSVPSEGRISRSSRNAKEVYEQAPTIDDPEIAFLEIREQRAYMPYTNTRTRNHKGEDEVGRISDGKGNTIVKVYEKYNWNETITNEGMTFQQNILLLLSYQAAPMELRAVDSDNYHGKKWQKKMFKDLFKTIPKRSGPAVTDEEYSRVLKKWGGGWEQGKRHFREENLKVVRQKP